MVYIGTDTLKILQISKLSCIQNRCYTWKCTCCAGKAAGRWAASSSVIPALWFGTTFSSLTLMTLLLFSDVAVQQGFMLDNMFSFVYHSQIL